MEPIDYKLHCCLLYTSTKNSIASSPNTFIGLSQTFERNIENPERVLVSYKIKASRNMNNICLLYTSGVKHYGNAYMENVTEPISLTM